MEVSYIRIYRDELQNDKTFDEYCRMPHAQVSEEDEGNSVVFYTIDVNDVPSEYLLEDKKTLEG